MESKSLTVVSGDKLETLADDLVERLREKRSVFAKEIVVAPSKGSARWLRSWIAKRDGICANVDFLLPKDFIVGRLCEMSEEDALACSSGPLRWRIFAALPKLIEERPEEFAGPAAYVEAGGSDSKTRLWQLAGKLADCFDQYITLRHDMILDWEASPEASEPSQQTKKINPQWLKHWRWQRSLWLEVMAPLRTHPPREFARILSGKLRTEGLPKRVFAFGFSTMPPVYLDLFAALGEKVETVLHYLNPCQGYWADIKSEKESLRELSKFDPEQWRYLHIDSPNELLSSFGKAGREFFARLAATTESCELVELFSEPGRASSALETLQSGVLEMAPAKELRRDAASPEGDSSVRIHSCHSRLREVEILRDEIFAALEEETRDGEISMRPSDVIVMAPDISKYAPFIKAVFGGERRGGMRIDFSIADQSLSAESPEASAILALLSIPSGRFTAEELLAPLDCAAVRAKLKLAQEDVSWLRAKLREAGASWGVDAKHRREVMERDGSPNPPSFEENSWRFALDRVLLGHAMDEAKTIDKAFRCGGRLFAPVGLPEGDGAKAAGAFACYFDKLEAFSREAAKGGSISFWKALLLGVVDDFLLIEGPDADGALETVKALGAMLSEAEKALGPDFEAPYEVILSAVKESVSSESGGGGFLRGGTTFCRMQPLRNIPARMVCLLGMNDKEFPRPDRERGFDLLREGRRLCDRSPRDDDRQLFLDALLSARGRLRIFYQGQSDKDNSPKPPSPAVDELIDHLKAVFGESSLAFFRVRHPLHPFSAKYFSEAAREAWAARERRAGDELWSFDIGSFSLPDLDAARALASRKSLPERPWAWMLQPLPQPEDLKNCLFESSVDSLAWRLRNLAKAFLRERVGVNIAAPGDDSLPDDEPFSFDALQDYLLKSSLLAELREKPSLDVKEAYRFRKARGELAGGAIGWLRFSDSFEQVESFSSALSDELGEKLPELRAVATLSPEDFPSAELMNAFFPSLPRKLSIRLELKTNMLFESGMAFFRPSSIKAKDLLAAWLGHLALNACEEAPSVKKAALFGLERGGVKRESFASVEAEEARRLLALLTCICLEARFRPLPFFPESSLSYAQKFAGEAASEEELALSRWPSQEALQAADRAWLTLFSGRPGEGEDEAFKFCFGSEALSRMSSEDSVDARIAALSPDGAPLQEWLAKAKGEKRELFRKELELERLLHGCALLGALPMLRRREVKKAAKGGKIK